MKKVPGLNAGWSLQKEACLLGGSYGHQQEEQEGKAKERSWNQGDQAGSAESGYRLTSKSAGGSEVANRRVQFGKGRPQAGRSRNECHRGDPGESDTEARGRGTQASLGRQAVKGGQEEPQKLKQQDLGLPGSRLQESTFLQTEVLTRRLK